MSAFVSELAYIKLVLYLLYSTDIPYTTFIIEMVDKPGKYGVGKLFTWCLVPGTNQAQLL